jgi:hypothetical protein
MSDSFAFEDEISQLSADLSREDEMGAVVRAHIRIENLLLKVVEGRLPHAKYLPKLNLDYDGLVTLALCLGLEERHGPAFRALGKLRNDFAHRLNTALNKQTVTNLYKALATEEKHQVQSMFLRIKGLNEETRHVARVADLEPSDQFKLIAVTLWVVVRATLHLQSSESKHGT